MAAAPDDIDVLRDVLRATPGANVPLRQLLADKLMGRGRADEAEKEYRQALTAEPENMALKTGLAHAFYAQGKYDQAIVLVENALKATGAPPRLFMLHARLLADRGELTTAAASYRRAVDDDPGLADDSLARRLNASTDKVAKPNAPVAPTELGEEVVERPSMTFADVGGMEEVKQDIRLKVIRPLERPDLAKAYGKPVGGGILMYGPPGCGKTHLARATAGEAKVGFVPIGINEVLTMWVGESEKKLHGVFDQARANAPCILFFDEVDALAPKRNATYSANRPLVNQFLSELDGIQGRNEGLLVLAATNTPWDLDTAFHRPGRFDRIVFVPPPDTPARAGILRILLRGKPIETIDYEQLARKTEHFSGADLKAVVDKAVEEKFRLAFDEGVAKPITTKDLMDSAGVVRPSTREWFATAKNHAMYADPEGRYSAILKYLGLKS